VKSPADDPNNGEEGLLSVAFPPGFGSGKNHFYVYYTNLDGNNQVSRFSVSQDPDIASSGSEELILLFLHPDQTNHNGGQIVFGPDGYLYIGTGDGGSGGDPNDNAQNPASLLGKMLRIDVEQDAPGDTTNHNFLYLPLYRGARGTSPATYSIPSDNPYADQFGYRGELWALGMRNPWRFSFDRLTHDLYIGDVGQGNWEEVDFQPAISQGGENYGWDNMEGLACYEPMSGCITAGMTLPIQVYANEAGCYAVTGGYVYRGANYPSMQGTYFYADYCIGKIWGLQPNGASWDNQEFLDTTHNISSFGEDQAGELYLTTLGGSVYQIVTP
jgi:glucose/arabinose dehydrogenase